ncbi:hypothetical protein ITJ43_13415 [Microbacterium sp. VKM Ac-2870]|uniref:hypothetical protein n=1 Tax=Microbacterium sp. VKM Ac-2870 TaxID=2783825 RepID=UPI00188B3D0B|nr:hypothetical protein [Microbacterium sp. VKM Ac-2870]MBF4563131.1 hypothetical protein [Microbacterium sp. VKM Ac-2870]
MLGPSLVLGAALWLTSTKAAQSAVAAASRVNSFVENSGVAVQGMPSSTVTAIEGWVFASTGHASVAGAPHVPLIGDVFSAIASPNSTV